MAISADKNPRYWQEYSNLQKVKHDLIRKYLGGWFPKLGSWAGRILFFDTHAGRGRHVTGELGSPLVALKTFLSHRFRDQILRQSEVRFCFIERDEENLASLRSEIAALGQLPSGVVVVSGVGDCYEQMRDLVDGLKEREARLAPAFVFVDPYGFKLPGELLSDLMKFERVELFINVIWRELNMAIAQGRSGSVAPTLDKIFGGLDWVSKVSSPDFDTRANQACDLFRELTDAKWATHIRMLGDNRKARYLLLHLTNHDAGRDLMKDCMWSVCPDGGYYARKHVDSGQQVLLTSEPDLEQLRTWVLETLTVRGHRWSELEEMVRPLPWRSKHLGEVIRILRRKKVLRDSDYTGRFSRKADPFLALQGPNQRV